MGGVIAPETKVKRVMKARLDAARANKKFQNFEATRERLQAQLAKLTDEEYEARQARAEKANKAVAWLESAPVTDDEAYEALLAEAEAAQADDEDEATDEAA